MVHVRPGTIDAIEERVDKNDGAAVIGNILVRNLEGMERLRLTRLEAVQARIHSRGLRTFPAHLHYSDEDRIFAVYRPELLVVDGAVMVSDPDMLEAWNFVLNALGESQIGQLYVSVRRFKTMICKLAPAHPKLHWEFKRHGAA
ncbi:hypothetical protein AB0D29_02075 [Streptomyces sp. NPDC048424]|uniref:hypothetical protein n=1 Tax=Streptomyces sp. NPDC048424 TaxID=3155265 RepID=UPI0034300B2F